MTIGVGLLCTDGIVLATDTEYTTGGVLKTYGPKLFTACDRKDVVAIVAGAGSVPFMKTAVDLIGSAIKKLPVSVSTEDAKGAAEKALLEFHRRHIYPVPKDIRPSFSLILGLWTFDGLSLFKSTLSNLVLAPEYETVGIGQYVACYALELVRARYVQVEQGKFVAVYCIKAAKDYVSGCGKKTNLWALDEKGNIERSSAGEVADIEEYCADLTNALRFAQLGLDIGELGKAEMDTLVSEFRDSITEFKAKQQKWAKVRERKLLRKSTQP